MVVRIMAKQRNLDREGLEVYLLYLLLAYRPFLQICGVLFLVFSALGFTFSPAAGGIVFILALLLITLTYSYNAVVYAAKFGAWLGTIRRVKE
jgi:hypothetical protein